MINTFCIALKQWSPKWSKWTLGSTGNPTELWLDLICTCFEEFWEDSRNLAEGGSPKPVKFWKWSVYKEKSLGISILLRVRDIIILIVQIYIINSTYYNNNSLRIGHQWKPTGKCLVNPVIATLGMWYEIKFWHLHPKLRLVTIDNSLILCAQGCDLS